MQYKLSAADLETVLSLVRSGTLAEHGEHLEAALESARSAAQLLPDEVSGTVRITTTDTILHGVVAPALKDLRAVHPLLSFELHTGNELASLTRRDADIAVRATKRPPQHLVGKHVGPIRVALFTAKKGPIKRYADVEAGRRPGWHRTMRCPNTLRWCGASGISRRSCRATVSPAS